MTYMTFWFRLIEHCWRRNPADRPTFTEIIQQLTDITDKIVHRVKNKVFINFLLGISNFFSFN